MKIYITLILCFFAINGLSQNHIEVTYAPFINDPSITNNVNSVQLSQILGIRYAKNHYLAEIGFEKLKFYDNAFVIDQFTKSLSFPREGNQYNLNYISLGLGYRTFIVNRLTLDNTFHIGFLLSDGFQSSKPIENSSVITANQRGSESIVDLKYDMKSRMSYEFPISEKFSLSFGLVVKTTFNPLVEELVTNKYFWSNKKVTIQHQLGFDFSLNYTLN